MLANKKVLLVDDNDVNLMVARAMLQKAGLHVLTATNGQLAIDQIENSHFDAILMDIQMPVMDGIEATKYIRDTLKKTEIPIIAVSANVGESDIQKSLDAGMVAHIPKPVVRKHLLSTLKQHIACA